MLHLKRLFDSFASAIAEQSKHAGLTADHNRSLLSYCVSPFATMCMVTAMVLNRITIFASSRRVKRLPGVLSSVLRLVALYLLLQGSYGVLVAAHTYYDGLHLPAYFTFDKTTFSKLQFLGLHYSVHYFEKRTTVGTQVRVLMGPTTEVLKPFYLALCISQIVETFVAVASGRKPFTDNSLTLFEYSLAFQEVQGGQNKPQRELLTIAVIALAQQLCTHLVELLHLARYRLIPSSILGTYTLAFACRLVLEGRVFQVPICAIMGYLPHLLLFLICCLSFSVYLLAGVFRGSFDDITATAVFENTDNVDISLSDDFYPAMMAVGSFVVSATADQGYLLQSPSVQLPQKTYVDSGYGVEVTEYKDMSVEGSADSWVFFQQLSDLKDLTLGLYRALRSLLTRRRRSQPVAQPHREQPARQLVDLSSLSEEELDSHYAELLLNANLADLDNSGDYREEVEEVEEEVDNGEDPDNEEDTHEDNATLYELITPALFKSLIKPSTPQEVEQNRVLSYHMQNPDRVLTRSSFENYYTEELRLADLIREKRDHVHAEDDEDEGPLGKCVICHVNSRQIILWPCRCLSICDSCRVALMVRKFDKCVCCRTRVQSYSKVYVP